MNFEQLLLIQDELDGAGLQKIGAAKDENARNNAATLAQRTPAPPIVNTSPLVNNQAPVVKQVPKKKKRR